MKRLNFALPILIFVFAVLACGKTEKEELKSGRLKFVKTLAYGSVGTHGSQGWYVSDRRFFVNDSRYSPPGIKMDDIGGCDASPNASVEALKCYSFADLKESVFLLSMNSNKPEWITVTDQQYCGGKNLGQWAGDGHWLLFKDYYYNVENSEKRPVKGLPDYPNDHFVAASPDLGTIVYKETGFDARFDLPPGADVDKEKREQYKEFYDHMQQGMIGFWLIEADTGKVTPLALKMDQYKWASPNQDKAEERAEWIRNFKKEMVWQPDQSGKDRLVYPN